jgi:hypothetical protein
MPSQQELLRAPLLKYARAEHHINDLARQVDAYLALKPVRLVTIGDPEACKETHFLKQEIPVPLALSLVAGDAIHNLRSVLDILIFSMIGDRARQPERVQFPFAKNHQRFVSALESREIELAGKNVLDALAALQPYGGGDDTFYGIHVLDVADKHKLILATTSAGRIPSLEFASVLPAYKGGHEGIDMIMETGAAFTTTWEGTPDARRAKSREIRAGEHEHERQPTFEILLDVDLPALRYEPLVPTLVEMSKRVAFACKQLVSAFLKP